MKAATIKQETGKDYVSSYVLIAFNWVIHRFFVAASSLYKSLTHA
ncbi:hypothetical protein PSE_2007 [Pseudovibrio sp. FO-BEG1]|nr:hypothetical protein PSE_2007 [Pseudovibrio sp. FO-BEG1]